MPSDLAIFANMESDQHHIRPSHNPSDEPKMNPPTVSRDIDEDRTVEALGYTNPYRRVLKTLGNMSMVISLTSPLFAILIIGYYQVFYGGYWGLVWGWAIPSVLFFPQALAAAALASSMPVSGAFYWWTAALAPDSCSHFLSFISGWTNAFTLVSSIASYSFAMASTLVQAITYVTPSWEPTNAQIMGISLAIIFLWVTLAALRLESISWIYVGCAAVVLVHLIVFVIALPVSHRVHRLPFAKASDVFASYTNYSDWPPAVAVPFTWFTAPWVNSEWAAPAYVAEATHDARRSLPRSIIGSYIATAVCGLIICMLTAFCITNMAALAADPSGFPLFTLLYNHWGPQATAAFLIIILIVTTIGGSAVILAYAFQIAAFARDGGVPFPKTFSRVSPAVNMPLNAIFALATAGAFLLLFALSSIAAEIIYSLAVLAYVITYSLPNLLAATAPRGKWVPGPFNYGRFDRVVFALAFASQLYLVIMEAFPPMRAWTAESFNYNWVVALGVIVFSALLYLVLGKRYVGIDREALLGFRREAQLDGVALSQIESRTGAAVAADVEFCPTVTTQVNVEKEDVVVAATDME